MARVAEYTLVYKNRQGVNMATISTFYNIEYAKKENDFGYLYVDLPNIYPKNYFEIDGWFTIYRKVGALEAYVELDAIWFIRLVRYKYDRGTSYIHIACRDGVDIVDRRIVAYPCSSSYSTKTGKADHVILAIMRENFGSLATDSSRNISGYFDIEADDSASSCPTITKSFCRRKVLPTIQEIALDSQNAGKYLCFDVVYNGNGKPRFETFTGQRGVDRGMLSGENAFIFSVSKGNMEYSTIAWDHLEEYNYIYAGGRGKDDDRIIATATNTTWTSLSPINRREDFIDARDEDDPASVQAEANQRLIEAGPKTKVNGHIIQTKESLYGVHYKFGDICIYEYEGITMNIHLDSVHVTISGNGDEDVKIYTRNLDDTEY